MKVLYFISLLIVALFFNACASKIVYSPEEIDTFAIPPSAENNLFSPPPKGYARLIMYRDDYNSGFLNDVFISYATNRYATYKHIDTFWESYYEIDNGNADRALCRLDNDSSCIVHIRAGKPVLLVNQYRATIHLYRYYLAMQIIAIIQPYLYTYYATPPRPTTQGTIFTPKNQHIYCLAIEQYTSFVFKNKNACLKEYKSVYSPKHRKEQDEWLNELIKKGDKRAYKE